MYAECSTIKGRRNGLIIKRKKKKLQSQCKRIAIKKLPTMRKEEMKNFVKK